MDTNLYRARETRTLEVRPSDLDSCSKDKQAFLSVFSTPIRILSISLVLVLFRAVDSFSSLLHAFYMRLLIFFNYLSSNIPSFKDVVHGIT